MMNNDADADSDADAAADADSEQISRSAISGGTSNKRNLKVL